MTAGPAGVAGDPIGEIGKSSQRPEYGRSDYSAEGCSAAGGMSQAVPKAAFLSRLEARSSNRVGCQALTTRGSSARPGVGWGNASWSASSSGPSGALTRQYITTALFRSARLALSLAIEPPCSGPMATVPWGLPVVRTALSELGRSSRERCRLAVVSTPLPVRSKAVAYRFFIAQRSVVTSYR